MSFFKASIRGERVLLSNKKSINWKEFLTCSDKHRIKEIIYSSIEWDNTGNLEKESIEQWKKDTFFTALSQMKHMKRFGDVLKEFNNKGIDVLVLKGLIVRELYPRPDLRTMSDADILVHKKDLDESCNILMNLGYLKKEECDHHGAHIVFTHPYYYPIEVHWTLINDEFFRGSKEFEKHIWNNAVKVNINEGIGYSLCLEDLALHLCTHMAVHIACGGFGVRQLADLVLLVEKKGDQINWTKFMNNVNECGVNKFVLIIFNICNELFDMKVPKQIKIKSFNKKYMNLLIDDIFKDGVYGHGDIGDTVANKLAFNKENNEKDNNLKELFQFIFPPISKMSDKYNYAKKHRMLSPIAWVHHLFLGIFNKDYNLIEKAKFIFLTTHISRKKNKLIKWLEL